MNVRVATLLTVSMTTITLHGCLWHNVDYSKFDKRCKEWTTKHTLDKYKPGYIQTSFSDIESRYAYYMCINITSGSMPVSPRVF